ncbi:MAG: 2-oxo acid dehydrogenase subunit E2 [Anaerolineae bacterium]|nr:2-oxo acid dehydrogenase subunit E2 [Anaerolineae bacterium]
MAAPVVMPKLGNTMESAIIMRWSKNVGDAIAEGDVLCEIETDKATMEVESTASGTLLARFFNEGDDVPVLVNIVAIGAPGEDFESLRPEGSAVAPQPAAESAPQVAQSAAPAAVEQPSSAPAIAPANGAVTHGGISPRARNLASQKQVDMTGFPGTGPQGRIIERDVRAALTGRQKVTPVAREMLASGGFVAPDQGSGSGGRITSKDLQPVAAASASSSAPQPVLDGSDVLEVVPVKGTRKIISQRMLASMQTTAQLTLNAFADARSLMAYRQRLKNSPEALGLRDITLNDLVMYAAARTLLSFPDLNAQYANEQITLYRRVHLGFAVDTPRGLIVPVIRNASELTLKQQAQEARRLAAACQNGTIAPDDLAGGTFTVTNLGNLGIETFTPILNPPQVAILGVGNIHLKPVEVDGDVQFIRHIGLSLTINHQVVDGAPAARFLQALTLNIAQLELMLAL